MKTGNGVILPFATAVHDRSCPWFKFRTVDGPDMSTLVSRLDLLPSHRLFSRRLFPVTLAGQFIPIPTRRPSTSIFCHSASQYRGSKFPVCLQPDGLCLRHMTHHMDTSDGYCNHLCLDETTKRRLLDCWALQNFVMHVVTISSAFFKSTMRNLFFLQMYFSCPKNEKDWYTETTKRWGHKCQQRDVSYEFSNKPQTHAPHVHVPDSTSMGDVEVDGAGGCASTALKQNQAKRSRPCPCPLSSLPFSWKIFQTFPPIDMPTVSPISSRSSHQEIVYGPPLSSFHLYDSPPFPVLSLSRGKQTGTVSHAARPSAAGETAPSYTATCLMHRAYFV